MHSTVQVYHADRLGSVRAITDASGSVVQTYQTDEFGVPTGGQGSVSQPFQYTGEQRDAESGFVYLRARMYDPQTGRFIQRDRFSGVAAYPVTLHRYAYAGCDPVNRRDASGFWYIDFNVTGGYIGGVTAGVQVNDTGIYPYVGFAVTTPGVGGSVTWSPQNPSPGLVSVGFQGQAYGAVQVGYGFGEGGGWYWEVGAGYPPGASASVYYTFAPLYPVTPAAAAKK